MQSGLATDERRLVDEHHLLDRQTVFLYYYKDAAYADQEPDAQQGQVANRVLEELLIDNAAAEEVVHDARSLQNWDSF